MTVDVIDLDFNTLNFNRHYDTNRYQRARRIYNNGDVQIENVSQSDNKYTVEALVNGNYGDYKVKIFIDGSTINKYSCTCEDFYNGNLCKHVLATSMEIVNPHYASTKEGSERLLKQQREAAAKRLAELKKIQEQERSEHKYREKYSAGLKAIELYKTDSDFLNHLDLNELYVETQNIKKQKPNELATSLKLDVIASLNDTETLSLSFKIGQTRMYVLNNIQQFYEAYKNKSELYYGKQLTFIPKREFFLSDSQGLFDIIIKYGEMLSYYKKLDAYTSFPSKEVILSGKNLDAFFDAMRKTPIIIDHYPSARTYTFTDDNLDISCTLKKEKLKIRSNYYWYENDVEESEEYTLRLDIYDYDVLFSDDYIYIFSDGKIYRKEKTPDLERIFDLFHNKDYILIPEDKLAEFKEVVLPKLKIQTANLPTELVEKGLIPENLACKLLLDVDDIGNILLELKFCYSDYEFNVLDPNYLLYVEENNIVRDFPKEASIVKRIFLDGFSPVNGKNQFVMHNSDNIYDFLSYKIEKYMQDFEVLATDKFKNKQIKHPKISNIGVKVDNGLLELDISKMNIDIHEIKDILQDYNVKKKYYKLKNGDFLDLSKSQDLDLLDEMMVTLDIDYNKIDNGVIELPINRSIYLEKLIESTDKNITVSKNDNFKNIVDNIGNTNLSDEFEIDKSFENVLRDYQKTGFKWLKTLEKYQFGGILADDMGLGKTLQIISLLKSSLENESEDISIVVCPSTLVLNWKSEIEKWCNELNTLIVSGTAQTRKDLIHNTKGYNLLITSYDLLKRDIAEYENKNFKYIIADEAQYIKNYSTQNATALKSLKGKMKIALTGTPIENSVAELWSIFDFIMPGYLYNYNKFRKKFEEPILKSEDANTLIRLKKLISPFILRRTKKDVLTELPEKNITIMKNEMEKEQEKIYLSYLAQTKEEIAEQLSDNSFEKSKFKILMLLTRLRQICCHPSLFIENYHGTSGKLEQCINLVTDAIESGHKILLFSSYTSMFELIEKQLQNLNIQYFKLVGSTPVDQRVKMVDEFNNDNSVKVFLISLKAGGTGLNLTSADVVIHYDPWWNVSAENQATDRAYRIGQKNSVQVYKLITSNSIEEKINKMQERKEKLSKDILSTEETFISKMSKEEILDLFE